MKLCFRNPLKICIFNHSLKIRCLNRASVSNMYRHECQAEVPSQFMQRYSKHNAKYRLEQDNRQEVVLKTLGAHLDKTKPTERHLKA